MNNRRAQLPRGAFPVFLLALNVLPLYGVANWGWSTFDLIFLYWFENVVIGAITVIKMVARPYHDLDDIGATVNTAPFFVLHYGMFCAVHGAFVFSLFGSPDLQASGLLGAFLLVPEVLDQGFLFIGASAMILLHVGDYARDIYESGLGAVDQRKLMAAPYPRIMVLHVLLIGAGFLLQDQGNPAAGVVLLVALKTAIDLVKWSLDERKLDQPKAGRA